jgi:hypothetical protein
LHRKKCGLCECSDYYLKNIKQTESNNLRELKIAQVLVSKQVFFGGLIIALFVSSKCIHFSFIPSITSKTVGGQQDKNENWRDKSAKGQKELEGIQEINKRTPC